MKLALVALAAACALLAVAAPAAAQSGDPAIRMQLDSAVALMATEGYTLQGAFRTGDLGEGAAEMIRMELRGGQSYIIVGVCDVDCTDLDFRLADPAGTIVGSDFEPDDVPMVSIEVPRTGDYGLTVSMAACSIEPCGYGVAVFSQRQ
jgi:hypothetical protein